jgi:hypothetical protein
MGMVVTLIAVPESVLVPWTSAEAVAAAAEACALRTLSLDRAWAAIDYVLRKDPRNVWVDAVRGKPPPGAQFDEPGAVGWLDWSTASCIAENFGPDEDGWKETLAWFGQRFDAAELDEVGIYPRSWRAQGDAAREYVEGYLARLVEFYDPFQDERETAIVSMLTI